uniref:Uncharacterized protein n=1 Tax=Anopheles maculatus TaxID=74869 RepID=A0A182SUF4_9DIPT
MNCRASNTVPCNVQHQYASSFEPYVQSDGITQSIMPAVAGGSTLSGLVRPPPALSVLSTSSNCSSSTTATNSHQHHQHNGMMEQQQQHHSHMSILPAHSPVGSQNHHRPHHQYDDTSLSDCGQDGGDHRVQQQQTLPSVPAAFSFTSMSFTDNGEQQNLSGGGASNQLKRPATNTVLQPSTSAGLMNSTGTGTRRNGNGGVSTSSRSTSLPSSGASTSSTSNAMDFAGLEELTWLDMNNNTSWIGEGST